MKTKLILGSIIVNTMLIGSLAYADQYSTDHPMTYVKDSIITGKVKAKFVDDELIRTQTDIQVNTDARGVVVLSGTSMNKDAADRAEFVARHTDGVADVWNHVKVK